LGRLERELPPDRSASRRYDGWGHSWSAFFRPWYESGKPRYVALNENVAFFLDGPQAREANIQFDLAKDREAVRLYFEALDAANTASAKWSGLAESRTNLLREHPELLSVS